MEVIHPIYYKKVVLEKKRVILYLEVVIGTYRAIRAREKQQVGTSI
jgi:hypothetical protein